MRLSRVLFGLLLLSVVLGAATLLSRIPPVPDRGTDTSLQNGLLAGSVRDGLGPVNGARVRLKGRPEIVESDAKGQFHLSTRSPSNGRVTAWKEGYFIAGQNADAPRLDLMVRRLPEEDCARYDWVDPSPDPTRTANCANCHGEIYQEWAASGHARSARGKHFRNLYEGTDWNGQTGVGWSLRAQNPDGEGVCASCHAPTTTYGANLTKLDGVAALGVHCDYCHKISGLGDGPIGLTHGRFNLNLLRPAKDQLFFGPLDDVDRDEDAFSPFYKDSKYCASCHEGVVFGVPVYSTYSEWQNSAARREGKQCQDCHMKPTGTMTNIAPAKGGIERDPKSLGNHRFFAGSQEEMLKACVKLSVRAAREAGGVKANVEVWVDGVGHRVPTGFIDRHLLLVVEAFDAQGQSLAGTVGPMLPSAAGKPLAGLPGKLYAKLLKDDEGHSPAPFWRADPQPEDSRLTPGVVDKSSYVFSGETLRVRVRVLYRRFWWDVAEAKNWPDNDVEVAVKESRVSP